ncbi:MAG TPA: S8 family serine peptidase [Gemmatimonadales bacterium]|nr:S8 family serine peptidase [Gemmatimonadales bacterium]
MTDSVQYSVDNPTNNQIKYYRRVVDVLFKSTVTGAQIQDVLTRHQGQIVGGSPDEGSYQIQFPDPGVTFADLDAKVSQIEAEPTVEAVALIRSAAPLDSAPMASRYPLDHAPEFTRVAWTGTSSAATWPFRAVQAPLAWGCENGLYGSTPPDVGVLEWRAEVSNPEISSSIVSNFSISPKPGIAQIPAAFFDRAEWHGTAVAGMVAAEGNNGQGAVGMLWHGRLRIYQAASPNRDEWDNYIRVLRLRVLPQIRRDKPRVLTISIAPAADSLNGGGTRREITLLTNAFRRLLTASPNTLITFAIGNEATTWGSGQALALSTGRYMAIPSVLAQLRLEGFGDRILFVAGTAPGNQWWSFSNLVVGQTDIAAPADTMEVLGLNRPGTFFSSGVYYAPGGTSFATPMVAGVAAQLLTMDSTLTAAQVKDYLIRGAREPRFDPTTGGLLATQPVVNVPSGQQVYQLNAYGSLSLLARERQHTPLCGNRVWVTNGTIQAQRDTTSGAAPENLATIGDDAGYVYVHHGGRRIDLVGEQTDSRAFLYSAGSWTEGDYWSLPQGLPGGTGLSIDAISHDMDSVAYVSASQGQIFLSIAPYPRGTARDLPPITVPLVNNSTTGECRVQKSQYANDNGQLVLTGHTCIDTDMVTGTSESASALVSYSPLGDRLIVSVYVRSTQVTNIGSWAPCPWTQPPPNDQECRTTSYSSTSSRTELWNVPLPSGSPATKIGTITGVTPYWLGIREDGSEFVSGEGAQTDTWTARPYADSRGIGWETVGQPQQLTGCEVKYRNSGNPTTLNLSVPSAYACFGWPGGGTIAPNRVRLNPPTVRQSGPRRLTPSTRAALDPPRPGLNANRRRNLPH